MEEDKLITLENLSTFHNNVINDQSISDKSSWSSSKLNNETVKSKFTSNNKVVSIWKGTQSEYDSLTQKDQNTLYIIV